jgi:hypothetical protein
VNKLSLPPIRLRSSFPADKVHVPESGTRRTAYLASCDPLDKGAHLSPLSGEGHVRFVVPTLSPPCTPPPETMLLECPPRVNGLW